MVCASQPRNVIKIFFFICFLHLSLECRVWAREESNFEVLRMANQLPQGCFLRNIIHPVPTAL